MKTEIQIESVWHECELSYPHQEEPLPVPGPGGTQHWQQSSYARFNAKLSTPRRGPIIPPGQYNVRHRGRQLVFEAQKAEGSVVWGNVL